MGEAPRVLWMYPLLQTQTRSDGSNKYKLLLRNPQQRSTPAPNMNAVGKTIVRIHKKNLDETYFVISCPLHAGSRVCHEKVDECRVFTVENKKVTSRERRRRHGTDVHVFTQTISCFCMIFSPRFFSHLLTFSAGEIIFYKETWNYLTQRENPSWHTERNSWWCVSSLGNLTPVKDHSCVFASPIIFIHCCSVCLSVCRLLKPSSVMLSNTVNVNVTTILILLWSVKHQMSSFVWPTPQNIVDFPVQKGWVSVHDTFKVSTKTRQVASKCVWFSSQPITATMFRFNATCSYS